jgi:hypothetical protein
MQGLYRASHSITWRRQPRPADPSPLAQHHPVPSRADPVPGRPSACYVCFDARACSWNRAEQGDGPVRGVLAGQHAAPGASGLGLEAQRKAIIDYLNGGNWQLVGEHVEVESGKRDDRPELAKAMAACRLYGAILIIAKLRRWRALSRPSGGRPAADDRAQFRGGAAGRTAMTRLRPGSAGVLPRGHQLAGGLEGALAVGGDQQQPQARPTPTRGRLLCVPLLRRAPSPARGPASCCGDRRVRVVTAARPISTTRSTPTASTRMSGCSRPTSRFRCSS